MNLAKGPILRALSAAPNAHEGVFDMSHGRSALAVKSAATYYCVDLPLKFNILSSNCVTAQKDTDDRSIGPLACPTRSLVRCEPIGQVGEKI